MTLDLPTLDRDDFAVKFDRFIQSATRNHPELRITPNDQVAWKPLDRPLSDCTVTLVTTAGVRHRDDTPFQHDSPWGDSSYRILPAEIDSRELVSDEIHLDTASAHEDMNCLFPVTRLRELADEGIIGAVAPRHFSMLGFLPDPGCGLYDTACDVAAAVKDSGADIALLTPG